MVATADTVDASNNLTPGSEAWRRTISASKVAAILGVSPWSSPLATWYEMKGLVERENTDTDATRRGTFLEPAILAWWQAQHPELLEYSEQALRYVMRGDEVVGIATLDALAMDDQFSVIGVEAKSSGKWDDWGKAGTGEVPRYYWWQTMWQMASHDQIERVYVPVIGPYLDFREYVVERDQATIDELVERMWEFKESLKGDTPPPLDSHKATLKTLSRLHLGINEGEIALVSPETAREYVEASLALKVAEERDRAARSAIVAQAGKAHYVETELVNDKSEAYTKRIARRQQKGEGTPYLVRSAKDFPSM